MCGSGRAGGLFGFHYRVAAGDVRRHDHKSAEFRHDRTAQADDFVCRCQAGAMQLSVVT
jgi:hypothetical protein